MITFRLFYLSFTFDAKIQSQFTKQVFSVYSLNLILRSQRDERHKSKFLEAFAFSIFHFYLMNSLAFNSPPDRMLIFSDPIRSENVNPKLRIGSDRNFEDCMRNNA